MTVKEGCEDDTIAILSEFLSADIFAMTRQKIAAGEDWSKVTVGTLRRNGRRLIILWQGGPGTNPRPWQIDKSSAVFDPYTSDWEGSVSSIVEKLQQATKSRTEGSSTTKNSLFVAQALSTPYLSPLRGPKTIEQRDGPALTAWINSLSAKDKVNIIIRDFIEMNFESIRRMLWLNAQKGFVYQSLIDQFKILVGQYLYVTNSTFGKGIVAGDNYDGKIYLQDALNRSNAKWYFQHVADEWYQVIDLRHGKAIVAGDNFDGNIYHQDPNNRDNALWKVTSVGTENEFMLTDKKHGKALIAGNNDDGYVYHNNPQTYPNHRWKLSIAESGEKDSASLVLKNQLTSISPETFLT